MFHQLADWQRAHVAPWLRLGRRASAVSESLRPLTAGLDLALLNLAAGELRHHDLRAAIERAGGLSVNAEVLAQTPFMRLRAFRPHSSGARRRLLVVMPHSGYAAAVAGHLLAALLRCGEILVIEWEDARRIPPAAGRFGLDEQIGTVQSLVRVFGAGVHVIALSQGVVPALAACALLAEDGRERMPASLTLIGGPVDPRINPTVVTTWLAHLPVPLVRSLSACRVPTGYPGCGRLVYPSLQQLGLFVAAHPKLYLDVQSATLLELLERAPDSAARSLGDLHAVIDVPAELVGDMLEQVYGQAALARGALMVGEAQVRPAAIATTALCTIEASDDALVGPGQTHAAHELCESLSGRRRARVTLEGAQHHHLFSGARVADRILPPLKCFLEQVAG